MSQVGIPGKQPLRWRLSCQRFIWQYPWEKNNCGRELKEAGWTEEEVDLQCALSGGLSQPSREF